MLDRATCVRRLLVATTNPGKLREIASILAGLPVTLESLAALANVPPAVESGRTFAENARLKALHYAGVSGLLTVADDSGLEIDALGGAPGVRSARFGEPRAGTYEQKFAEIYRQLDARRPPGPEPGPKLPLSTARFVCAVVLARADQILFETERTLEGWIVRPPRGHGGFGYDPVFFHPPYGRTLAEVTAEEKDTVSHRGQAFRELKEYLAREA